jgi:peptidyl-prolyl cis-trans isomerase C
MILPVVIAALLLQTQEPTAVVARINGKDVTLAEIEAIVEPAPAAVQAAYQRDPVRFLREYAGYRLLADKAEGSGLNKRSPYKEQLDLAPANAFARLTILLNAQLNEMRLALPVTPEEQRAYYEKHKSKYDRAEVQLVSFPFSAGETEALRLAQRGIESFASAARTEAITRDSTKVPITVRDAAFSLKPLVISEPIKAPDGYYVVRLLAVAPAPFEEVRDRVFEELKNIAFQDALRKANDEARVEMVNEKALTRK